jgi:hypothetical protein
MKTDFNKMAIWYDSDMLKFALFGAFVGFIVGVGVGYELGFKPVVNTVRYLIG